MAMAWRHGWIAATLALGGCADYSMDRGAPNGDIDYSGATEPSNPAAADTGATASEDGPTPAFYALALAFEALEGEIVEGSAAVGVDLWSDEAPPTPICRRQVPVLAAGAEEPPALDSLQTDVDTGAGGLIGWWWLDLDAVLPEGECPGWPARSLWFGLGPYDPRLNPSLDAAGLADVELYGLYVQEEADGPVYVVGVAGTQEMFAGGYAPDPQAPPPLPDGAYAAETLVLLSL